MSEHFVPADISAIIPVGARHDDLEALYREYRSALAAIGSSRTEFIFVLDGPRPKPQTASSDCCSRANASR